ncbi:MAG: 50S ribosome-binding GTPase [Planctomycetes bacterium]|nr:50S ribosome-binding GTPase [Planctomycetota bacterium]
MSALRSQRENAFGEGMTIVALATTLGAHGAGQRALIRLSGPVVIQGLAGIIDPVPSHRCACATTLTLSNAGAPFVIPVLVMRGVAPHTYTGQETLEILLPAQPHLVQMVLQRLMDLPGIRAALPGEFAARAFLAGKLSLDQAQHIAALISAARDEDLFAADLVRQGEPGQRAVQWAQEIAEVLALIEAGIDFADQDDVVAISVQERESRLRALLMQIEHQTDVGDDAARSGLARVVLWGAPNAGKSTLFNALLGKTRAVASPLAGTTRDVLEEEWEPALGDHVTLVDVAGIAEIDPRDDGDALTAAAQEAARRALTGADVVLWCDPTGCFSTSGRPPVDDRDRVLKIRTMADLPHATGESRHALAVCALDGWHLDLVAKGVHELIASQGDSGFESRHAAQLRLVPRHRAAVKNTVRRLNEALAAAHSDEVCATALRQALNALGEMTGHISADEVLGRVFARFCIGK